MILYRSFWAAQYICRIFLFAICFSLSGCGSNAPHYFGTTVPLHPPDEIWINNGQEPEWIDPGKCADAAGGEIILNIFSGLTEVHPQTLEPRPDVATHWDISEDGKEYTFYLRRTGWSDGTPVTAHDFKWSWLRVLDPKLASKYVANMFIFANAEAKTRGALYVHHLPTKIGGEQISEIVQQALPRTEGPHSEEPSIHAATFDFIQPVSWPEAGFMVFLSGVEAEKAAARAKIKDELISRFGDSVVAREVQDSDVGIEAVDDYTLRLRLENAIPYLLNFLSFYTFMPVPKHVIESLETKDINPNHWTREDYIVSNGAYELKKWKFRQYMEFEPNPYYWNAKHPDLFRVKKIKLSAIENYNTCLNMYHAGEVDYPGPNTSLPAEFMDHLRSYKDYRFDPFLSVYVYWINTQTPPMNNVHLRRALSLSIDRQKIVKYVTRAGQTPTASLVPDGLAGYDSPDIPVFDPDLAMEELQKAGYRTGEEVPDITLIYNTAESHKQIAEAVQQMWKKHLGINITIENQEWNVYLGRLSSGNFQIARLAWNGDYPDPFTFLELFMSNCGNNRSNWSSDEYDGMVKEANRTLDRQKRLDILRRAEIIALEHQPLIPVYVYTSATMIKPFVKGIWGNYQDRHPWKFMHIDERWYDDVPDVPDPASPPPDVWNVPGN